jgi:Zn-dependent protease
MGLAATALFFGSIVAHELSHAVVARASGIRVHSITLFVFGGVARTERDADTPGREFLIAGVGPLMSLALGGLFWAVALAARGEGGFGAAAAIVARQLAYLNVLLAVFNLLPGFPLDGGRLFRAVAWKLTGSLGRATRLATRLGRFFGYALAALGIWQAFRGNPIGGLWLVFIGWFLASAAAASLEDHVIRGILARARARDVMTREPEAVPADLTLDRLAGEFLIRHRYRAFPVVVRDGRLLGIITPADVALWVERRREMDEMGGAAREAYAG